MVQNQITMSLCLHYCYLTVGFCILTVFCEAVRSAILATAWLLVNKQGQAAKQEADSKTAKYQELKRHTFFSKLRSRQRDHGASKPLNWCKKSGDAPLSSHRTTDKPPSCFTGCIRGFSEGKCGLILGHFETRKISPPLQSFTPFDFKPETLC